jgi:hypothetical protein
MAERLPDSLSDQFQALQQGMDLPEEKIQRRRAKR